jgi:endoglucanase
VKQLYSFILVMILVSLGCKSSAAPPQTTYADYYPNNPMVHQVGRTIVDPGGKPLRLRGVNLGGWLHWEGWDFSRGFDFSENKIDLGLTSLLGPQAVADFHQQVYQTFITEADIQRISQLGFNSVRLPINYQILEDDNHPYTYKDSGWQLIDKALTWGEKYNVYVILDLHAVQGGQSGFPPSNPNPGAPLLWKSTDDQNRMIALWSAIAGRYKDRKIVAGYDLINEPLAPSGAALVNLYEALITAIRAVDPYHMLILEGSSFSSDFSMFSGPLSQNEMYGFHMYSWFGDNRQKKLDDLKKVSLADNVPLWAGEFGDNTYDIIASTVALYEDPGNLVTGGWSFWTWKKVPYKYPALIAITVPPNWQAIINWVNSPSKYPQPSALKASSGIQEFLQSVQLQNTTMDPKMAAALTSNWH